MANVSTALGEGAALIAGRFAVNFGSRLPDGGGGLPAYQVDGSLMAVQVQRQWPARARVLQALAKIDIPNLLGPLGHGPSTLPTGEAGYFVVTPAPPGPSLAMTMQPWSEQALVDRVLRPAALVLCELENAGVTHRAIRPDNVFADGPTSRATLGCAWAEPPGCHQPASLQPPYFTICHPGGQGDGAIADDVYALGAMLVWLALGRDPMAGLDDATIVQRKLDLGSYAALVGANRLPSLIADLVRGMLADDPEHRLSPTLLTDPAAARGRRAGSKPTRRAQRPLELAGSTAWTLPVLADIVRRQPVQCLAPLRDGTISQWVRRSVGDAALASWLDEVLVVEASTITGKQRQADATAVMQAIAVLDPLAPMVWRDTTFWPSGLGSALCHAMVTAPGSAPIEQMVEAAASEMIEQWTGLRSKRADHGETRALVRQFQRWVFQKPLDQAAARLCYAMNPLSPCLSPLLPPGWVHRLSSVLPAMEAAAGSGTHAAMLDQAMVAFIAARREDLTSAALGRAITAMVNPGPLATLRLLAELQGPAGPPAPHLARRLAEGGPAILARYHSRSRRERLTARLTEITQGGDLMAMLNSLEDSAELEADADGRSNALARIDAIDRLLLDLGGQAAATEIGSRQIGYDIAAGAGMLALGVALAFAVVS